MNIKFKVVDFNMHKEVVIFVLGREMNKFRP